jgi:hypothetical protein
MITLATSLPRYLGARVRSGVFITRPRVNLGIRLGAAPCAVRDIHVTGIADGRSRNLRIPGPVAVWRPTGNSREPDATNQRFLFD